MSRYHIAIFLTGGITLSLELLASRILSPYFGVSLYIWTGILSITLIALSVGYWWGGRLAAKDSGNQFARLSFLFALMPAISCLSIVLAALAFPHLFIPLASYHLVLGSFLACCILLLVPLIAVSAMNPLLVAIDAARRQEKQTVGDAGAGWVFFVSTLGSVLGVLVTAFLLVPNVTNFHSLLLLAIALAALAALLILSEKQLDSSHRKSLLTLTLVGGLAALALVTLADQYLGKNQTTTAGRNTYRLIHEKPTFFGNIKIVDGTIRYRGGQNDLRLYLVDGLAQCVQYRDGQPGVAILYGMEAVARGLVPEAKRILVLGMAGGILPMRFAAPGVEIDVVEINPAAIELAEQYFNYDASVANHYVMDARVYAQQCQVKYDLIFADLFHGDSTPEYLMTYEFLRDLAGCLQPHGGMVIDMVAHSDPRFQDALYSYVKTAQAVWPHVQMYHGQTTGSRNQIILASAAALAGLQPARISVPRMMRQGVLDILQAPRELDPERLQAAPIFTDDRNVSSIQNAQVYLQSRLPILKRFPPAMFVN